MPSSPLGAHGGRYGAGPAQPRRRMARALWWNLNFSRKKCQALCPSCAQTVKLRNFTAITLHDYVGLGPHPASQRTFDTPAPAPQPSAAPQRAWRVALRVVHDVEEPTMRATLTAGGESRREESKRDDDVTPAVHIR